jgi:hypothetical protein
MAVRSNAISESGVVYFSAGGHNHDGVSSTIIDTSKYSIFDFSFSYISTNNDRLKKQSINELAFKNYIINTVNQAVLEPAGVRLQDNVINARNIIAGSITSVEIAANTITANNIAANAITANEIAANTITGDLIAANTITADKLAVGALSAGSVTISGSGDYWNSDGSFRLGGASGISWSNTGSISFGSSISITGNISSSGSIDGGSITGAAISGGSLSSVTVSSLLGSIGGWTISSSSLTGGSTTLYSNGTIVAQIIKTGTSGARIEMGENVGSGEELYLYGDDGTLATIRNPGGGSGRISSGGSNGVLSVGYSSSGIYVTAGFSAYGATIGGVVRPLSDNSYTLGFSTGRWTEVWATNGTIQTSDSRLKTDINNSILGLDFINQLRPVSYKWIIGYNEQEKTDDPNPSVTPYPGVRDHYGFISQEVKSALDIVGCDSFAGWVLADKDDPDSQQSLRYTEFIAPIVKAVQELSLKLDALDARISALESGV